MNAEEKKQFIRDLVATVSDKALETVAMMPDEWDGHELRLYLADLFQHQVSSLMDKNTRRRRSYQNAVAKLVNP